MNRNRYFIMCAFAALLASLMIFVTGCHATQDSIPSEVMNATPYTPPTDSVLEEFPNITSTPTEASDPIVSTTEPPTEVPTVSESSPTYIVETSASTNTEPETVPATEVETCSTTSPDLTNNPDTFPTIEPVTEATTIPDTEPEKEVINPAAIAAFGCSYAQSLGFTIDYSLSGGYLPGLDYPISSMEEGYNHIAGCVAATRDQLIAANGTIEGCRFNCTVEYSRTDAMGDWYIFWCYYG